MASLIRITFTRMLNNAKTSNMEIIRNISGKTMRATLPAPKPKPYDYNNKSYPTYKFFLDRTTSRFTENTKVIVVEGPLAAGKSKFAKELADELEMKYYPEANLDMWYINDYGFDTRTLDDQLPESCKSFDVNNFMLNPKHRLSAQFQVKQYAVKFSQYIDALAHLLSTGQGVILDRCVYSDFVFVEAMYSQGYISKGARSFYYDLRKSSIGELLRPHLIIYLDVPVGKVLENVKNRNIPYECNSPVLNAQYLTTMEQFYKQKYLKEMSVRSELLVYDWTNEGETEVIVEDIERMKFENYDDQNPKFEDWMEGSDEAWALLRQKYSDTKGSLMYYLNVPRYDVPELITDADDSKEYRDIMNNAPGNEYVKGYNASLGDGSLWFKTKLPHRETLPLRERRIF
nr:NADH dehydrogenase [ubiquinone] 1 alpha subcomplex subunit 10, mitochondrial [Onthophagus taurus]